MYEGSLFTFVVNLLKGCCTGWVVLTEVAKACSTCVTVHTYVSAVITPQWQFVKAYQSLIHTYKLTYTCISHLTLTGNTCMVYPSYTVVHMKCEWHSPLTLGSAQGNGDKDPVLSKHLV